MAVTDTEQLSFEHEALTFSAQAMGDGPIVLCLHGFPDNARSFRHQLPALAEAGYRAISLTLRGYEPGAIPADGDYTMETIATDILAVIESLDTCPVHLIGHDWGAAVAYVATSAAPERFKSLTVMAVPHAGRFAREGLRIPKQLRLSWYMGFFNIPWLQKTNSRAFCQAGESYCVVATNGRHLNDVRIRPHSTQDLIQHCR